uniref:Extended synaptotagmin-3 n=1 Tax=Leptobrachium leishanense TaxID=445787 RepID=A0A8C5PVD7_9ANUR
MAANQQRRDPPPGNQHAKNLPPGNLHAKNPPPGNQPPCDPPPGAEGPLQVLLRLVLGVLVPGYVFGRLGLGLHWLLLGVALWVLWRQNRSCKLGRLRAAWDLLEDEELWVTRGLKQHQLPAWVNFPDVERVEWLNKVLAQMWPYLCVYMEKIFEEKIQPLVRDSNVHLKGFTFTKISFGQKSPKIHGVKAYTERVDKREIILDLQFSYTSDCEINVEVKKLCNAGVKGLQIHGTVRVILAPLMPNVPFFGAITMFFLHRPILEISWTGLTFILDIPGFSDVSEGMIVDIIASYLVLPNRLTFPLSDQVNTAELRYPVPRGVLRAHLIEAENLIPKDVYMKGLVKGKSDPYGILRVGKQTSRSRTIERNLNPHWGETYEFVVHEVPGQDLEVDLLDEDPDKDDFLGSLVISLEGVMKDRVVDEWFPLSDVASGQVHLRLEWFSLLASGEKLSEAKNGLSSAMLLVYLDKAANLPKNHFEYSNNQYASRKPKSSGQLKTDKEPSSYVLMTVGKRSSKSKTCATTKDPVWDEAFAFLIQDVHSQHLNIEIKDDDRQCVLGILTLPLRCLLSSDDLTLDQRFPLTNSGQESFIKMKVLLRVLHIEPPDPQSIYSGINSLKHGPVSIRRKENQEKSQGKPHKPDPKETRGQQARQVHTSPPPKVSRKESVASTGQRSPQPVPEQQQTWPKLSPASSSPAPRPANLRNLQRIAPSLISLNSVASSCYNPYDGHGGPGEVSGEVQISVRYTSIRCCLIVEVISCRNLIQCTSSGADPYVRIYLLPDRRWNNRKKTTVKRKTLNPEYNERFEFHAALEDAKKRMLDIAVKNNRSFVSHERKELGKVLVDLSKGDLSQGFTVWLELTADGFPRAPCDSSTSPAHS